MSETEKTMAFLGIGGGIAMLIGALILFLQSSTITGHQFHTDWSGLGGGNEVAESFLSWHGLVFLGLVCIGMGVSVRFKKEEEYWKE